MPLQLACPHCNNPCLIADEHLGVPVNCSWCNTPFVARPPAAPPVAAPVRTPAPVRTHAPAGPPRLDIGSATSTGRVRDRNEDSFLVQHLVWSTLDERHEIALLVVADGMGGHEAGHVASGLAIRTIGSSLAPLLGGALSGQFKSAVVSQLAETIDFALIEANRAVYRKGQGDPTCKGMGATAEVVLIWDGRALIGHVGDCRVYHLRGGRLTQVTRDQTLVARMVELGTLTAEEARTHSQRNEVAQAVGKRFDLEPARYEVRLAPGDWLITACDGLHAHLDGRALQEALSIPSSSATLQARELVDLADRKGGSDNCTVVAVQCW